MGWPTPTGEHVDKGNLTNITAKELADILLQYPDFNIIVEHHFLVWDEILVDKNEQKIRLI